MPKRSKEYSVPDADNPEWTKEKFARAKRLADIPELQGLLKQSSTPRIVPAQKRVSLRLSADVLAALRATGHGWQARADQALREWMERERQDTKDQQCIS